MENRILQLCLAAWILVAAGFVRADSGPVIGRRADPLVVRFDIGRADLKVGKAEEAKIEAEARELNIFPYAKLAIEGYSDITGPEKVNQNLSERRAQAVRQYFVMRYGISPARIVVEAFGKKRPAASNATPEGRKENRRAVARVYRLETANIEWGSPGNL